MRACLVELRFAVAGGALEHSSDLVMLEAFDIVKDKDHAVAGGADEATARSRATRSTEPGESEVAAAEVALGCVFFRWVDGLSSETRLRPFLRRCMRTKFTVRR